MSFDEIPEDKVECYACPVCDIGNLCETKENHWECDNCDFTIEKIKEKDNEAV